MLLFHLFSVWPIRHIYHIDTQALVALINRHILVHLYCRIFEENKRFLDEQEAARARAFQKKVAQLASFSSKWETEGAGKREKENQLAEDARYGHEGKSWFASACVLMCGRLLSVLLGVRRGI